MSKKGIITIVIVSVISIILIPFTIEVLIFRNEHYSVLTNGEWSGFLGSYIGGIFGGIGTLLAVYITTKQTRLIQDNDLSRFENEQQKNERKERKIFCDKIAENVARYITDISTYSYMCYYVEDLNIKELELKSKSEKINSTLSRRLEDLTKLDINKSTDEYVSISSEIEALKHEDSEIKYKLQILMADKNSHKIDRSIAVERFFLLNIQLKDVEYSDDLIKQLKYIHQNSGWGKLTGINFIEKETDKLVNATIEFIKNYVG